MILKSCLLGYLNILLILITITSQIGCLQCAALDPVTPTNAATKVIKKPPLHPFYFNTSNNTGNSSAGTAAITDPVGSSDKKPDAHKYNLTSALPNLRSKFISEQAVSSAPETPRSSIHNSDKLVTSVELDRSELVKQIEKSNEKLDDAKQREEENSLERQLKAQKSSGQKEDSKLKRTKRRGRIGGKASSAGIGHGRTGAKQDTSNAQSVHQPAFLFNLLVLLCSPLIYLKVIY